jgi:hypothetical protein
MSGFARRGTAHDASEHELRSARRQVRRQAVKLAVALLVAPAISFPGMLNRAQPVGATCVQSATTPGVATPNVMAPNFCINPPGGGGIIPGPPATPTPTVCPGPPAHGCNGQQLALGPSCDANWAFIQGTNQDDQHVTQWFLVGAAVPENGCDAPPSYDSGWWWKGNTQIDGYWHQGTDYAGTVNTYVPSYQDSSVWWFVRMP